MERFATDNVIGEVKHSRKTNLFIGWHLVKVKPVENTGLNLSSRLLRLCFVKEGVWRIHEGFHKGSSLLGSQNAAVYEPVDQLAGNAFVHQEARGVPCTACIDYLTHQPRQGLGHVIARG